MNLSSVLSASNISTPANGKPLTSKAFVFTPLQYSTRLKLFVLLVSVGIIGIVGNFLVLCFLKSRKRKIRLTRISAFEKNFLLYIKSLAISDVLCDVIALPPICCQLYFDVFNRGWSCRIVRYLNIVFAAITTNNLLFISIERYFSTRQTLRSLRHSAVNKVIIFAWLAGLFIVLFPAATYRGIRFDINDTHYTVVCKYDNSYLPFRIVFLSFIIIQYIVPGCIIIRINVSLIITLWTRLRTRKVDVQGNNASTIIRRSAIIRGTSIIVTLTFAFVLPYFFLFLSRDLQHGNSNNSGF